MPESVKRYLGEATTRLTASSQSPRLDAELLLASSLDWPRSRLYSRAEEQLSAEAREQFLRLLAARAKGQPIAYLLGTQEFWSLQLEVGPECLIPRPETEMLVELAISQPLPAARVLDLGTGSGAIAIAVAHEKTQWQITAVDQSSGALSWAKRNAEKLGCEIEFLQGSWFAPVAQRQFDLILSNPPYIADTDPHLDELQAEPQSALSSGADGLEDIRQIIAQAPQHLTAGGLLALEHGYDQGAAVRELLTQAGFVQVQTAQDLAGLERISQGRLRA